MRRVDVQGNGKAFTLPVMAICMQLRGRQVLTRDSGYIQRIADVVGGIALMQSYTNSGRGHADYASLLTA